LVVHFGYSQEKKSVFPFPLTKGSARSSCFLIGTKYSTQTDSLGHYTIENIAQGHYKIQITATGFETLKKNITFNK
jgi:outer membrane receptor for ferrienterochelin and colicins